MKARKPSVAGTSATKLHHHRRNSSASAPATAAPAGSQPTPHDSDHR